MQQLTLRFEDAGVERARLQSGDPAVLETTDWPKALHSLRWQLGLSQGAFCARYRLPIEEIAAIEAGLIEPCPVLSAYLTIITRTPALVARVCASRA
ncbi:MAG: hypothetical protein GC206_04400 [Alphaproteobacteria bacterium]|nr:hypothetical protein [Alphaproteobacteria bacterium]